MKLNRFTAITIVLAAGMAQAQNPTTVGNIPFDFTVLGQTMHAGKYTITESVNGQTVTFRRQDWKATAIAIATSFAPADAKEQARVEFRQYGNQYFLKGVWVPGGYHTEFPKSAGERRIAESVKTVDEPVEVSLR